MSATQLAQGGGGNQHVQQPNQTATVRGATRQVDIERQCGVILPNGRQCGGSLKRKRHSMGAKRAVAGRSAPFDMLLAQVLGSGGRF